MFYSIAGDSGRAQIRGGTILPVSCKLMVTTLTSLSITREELFLLYVTGSNHVS